MSPTKFHFSKGSQLTVYIDNRKGTLAALVTFLARHGVQIYGLTLADTEGHGYARMIVDDTEKARQLVEDAGELVAVREVVRIRVGNKPEELAHVLEALAEHNLNIEYGYSVGGPGNEKGLVIVPSDVDEALAVLQELVEPSA